jgi:hypothetical protein
LKEKINLDLALVHYPVQNKNNEIIGSAVTNLDLHDLARAGKTFGVRTVYIITPYKDQQELTEEILEHWLKGHGAQYNKKRKHALELVHICNDLEQMYEHATEKWGKRPLILATCAKEKSNTIGYKEVHNKLYAGENLLLLFGTAWGLTEEVLTSVDAVLPPIKGPSDYNHLSVRAAVAITLDRIAGE